MVGWGPNTQASSVLAGACARAVGHGGHQVGGRLAGRRAHTTSTLSTPSSASSAPGPGPGRRRPPRSPGRPCWPAGAAAAGRPDGAAAWSQVGQHEAGVDAGVGGQRQRPAAVAHQRHPVAGRQRLAGQHPGHVEQLGQRVDPDDAGLLDQGVQGVGCHARPRRGRRGPPPAAHGHDRLGADSARAMRLNLRALPNDSR